MIKISRTGLVLEFASYKSWFMGEVRYTQRIKCSIQGKLEVIKEVKEAVGVELIGTHDKDNFS